MNRWLRFSTLAVVFLGLVAPTALVAQVQDDFDDDPQENPDFELHQPQTGILYSIVEDGANNWWRWEIPALGDLGLNWDSWTTVDLAPKLRHAIDPGEDFVIQTRVRIDPAAPPAAATNNFLAGLMIQFSEFDLIHWNIGQLRSNSYNIFMERSGINDIITRGLEPGLLSGTPVRLMVERIGSDYDFYYSLEADGAWVLAGTYQTFDEPIYVGLIMKTWGAVAFNLDWDYFYMPPPSEAAEIAPSCDFGDPDTAVVGVTYTRAIQLGGWPRPDVEVNEGPPELVYDPAQGVLTGWIPDTPGEVSLEIEAVNDGGSEILSWTVNVLAAEEHDDDFDEDPRDNLDYWDFYEPQGGINYDIVANDATNWWRMEVPMTGDRGLAFDNWSTVDNAPLLRHPIEPGSDFIIETRIRIDDVLPPLPADPFFASLLVGFSQSDVITWGVGQERFLTETYNICMERSGANNLITRGYEPMLLFGEPVSVRVEKKCDVYYFSYRLEADGLWVLAGTYETSTPPVYVGLIMKTWGAGTAFTVDFDYFDFVGDDLERLSPQITTPCDFPDPDIAWLGMPYVRPIEVDGFPKPSVTVTGGGAGLVYDSVAETISGWTPGSTGAVSLSVEGTNELGTDTLELNVEVFEDPEDHDDEFDDDPRDNIEYWSLYEPQTGVLYSTVEDGGNSWWRMAVPFTGDSGLDFDTWTTVDRAPQLRHAVDPAEDWVIETQVRIDPAAPPLATDYFFAGLMVYFSQYDLIQWTVGNERPLGLVDQYNICMERSGFNNLIVGGYESGLLLGVPVKLRIEKICNAYNFFYRLDADEVWTLAGTHRSDDPPLYVGLLMKTWGGGVAFTVDFDYFDILEAEGGPQLPTFVRGDADASNVINITDGIRILAFLFTGGLPLECDDAGDTDDDGSLTITDAIKVFGYLFLGQGEPASPVPSNAAYVEDDCDVDPTPGDSLGCRVISPTCGGP